MQPRNLPSTFCVAAGPSVYYRKLLYILGTFCYHSMEPWTFRHLQSNFCAVVGLSVNFHQLSVRPRDLPCTFLMAVGPSVNFLCVCTTFRQLPSSFHASAGPSVNLYPLSVLLRNLMSIFRAFRTNYSTTLVLSITHYFKQFNRVDLHRPHEILFYDPCSLRYSVVLAVRLC